ncbi:MAG: flavin reductase [Cyclobacteriaceae bacterium]|nr:flavin reductase [Cyclobacteriaceae bacterium HetDA_MAG_MS6]
MRTLNNTDILKLPKLYRNNLINSISGFKSANLIGSVSENNHYNLAIFSSVVHMGSNPPLLGFITRPHSVPRHTYENIKATGFYTINHVPAKYAQQAHQTSAKYDIEVDEFEVCGFTKLFSDMHSVPYVQESNIRIGLKLEEEYHIKANDTILVIGSVIELIIPDGCLEEDGYLDLANAESVTINGLDGYLAPQKIDRYTYARPHQPAKSITK